MLILKTLLWAESLCRKLAYKLQMKRVQVSFRIIQKLELSIKAIDEKAEEAKEKVRKQIDEVKSISRM